MKDVKWLSGRELGGSEDSYFLPQPDSGGIYRDMLEGHEHGRGPGYLDAIEFLTINEENRLKRKVEKLEDENDQIKELQRQIVEINKKIGKQDLYDLSADIELYRKMNNDEAAIEEGRKGELIIADAKKDPELGRLLGLTDGLFGLNRKNT
jgi:hypothetical protein